MKVRLISAVAIIPTQRCNTLKVRAKVVVIALSLAMLGASARACSTTSCLDHGPEFHSSFKVEVRFRDKPLKGVNVEIQRYAEGRDIEAFSGETDPKGSIEIRALSAGNYWITVQYLGIGVGEECFHVSDQPSSKAKRARKYTFGELAPSTRNVKGEIIDAQRVSTGTPLWNITHPNNVPIAGAKLRLQDPLSGAIYTVTSREDGSFNFPGVPDGTYALHVEGGTAGEANFQSADRLVNVSVKAKGESVILRNTYAGGGSCGGMELEIRN
jgi:Carboxypeptidase regulatory-like domain